MAPTTGPSAHEIIRLVPYGTVTLPSLLIVLLVAAIVGILGALRVGWTRRRREQDEEDEMLMMLPPLPFSHKELPPSVAAESPYRHLRKPSIVMVPVLFVPESDDRDSRRTEGC